CARPHPGRRPGLEQRADPRLLCRQRLRPARVGEDAHRHHHPFRHGFGDRGPIRRRLSGPAMSDTLVHPNLDRVAVQSFRQISEHRRAFLGIMACFLVHGLVVSTWVSRIASVKSALHLGDGALGLALLGTAIGSVTAIPLSGALVVRHGSRLIARCTAAGFCLSLLAIPLAHDTATLFAALLFYGAMAGANDVAMNAQAVATEKLLGTPAISRFHAMFSIGGLAGATGGAFIVGRGVPPAPHLVGAAAVFLVFALAATRLLADTRPRTAARAATAHPARVRLPVALFALSAIGFCIFLSEGAIADWTGVFLHQVLGVGAGLAPVGYAVFSAAMAIFR